MTKAIVKSKLKASEKKAKIKQVKEAKAHKGQVLNLWDEEEMKWAIRQWAKQQKPNYKGKVYSMRGLADATETLNYSTLRKRLTGEVKGFKHASGGKGNPRVLSQKTEGELLCYIIV